MAAHGQFAGPKTVPLTLPSNYPILLGTTDAGGFVTVFGCQVLSRSLPLLTKGHLKVWPTVLAYDVHFDSVDDFSLKSLSLRYSNLDAWTATSGFAVGFSASGYPVDVRYTLPEGIEVDLP